MQFPLAYFITWTTYGSWLPGDSRGWKKWKVGEQQPRPQLAAWCRNQMTGQPLIRNPTQRQRVDEVCRKHAAIRNWELHAVSARSNHVHLAVSAARDPKIVRDQFKANATRVLREELHPIVQKHVWTGGGDIEFIDSEADLQLVIVYVNEAQDRMDRDM